MAHPNASALPPARAMVSLVLAIGLLLGCASAPRIEIPTTVPELRPGILTGYLTFFLIYSQGWAMLSALGGGGSVVFVA